jgi:hypothetical protein
MSETDARQLAELMAQRRTLVHSRVAGMLRSQADIDFAKQEKSADITLDRDELDALANTLAEEPWAQEQEWFDHLREEVARARAIDIE